MQEEIWTADQKFLNSTRLLISINFLQEIDTNREGKVDLVAFGYCSVVP